MVIVALATFAAIAAALAALLLFLAWRYQERLVWQPPPHGPPGAHASAHASARRVEYVADDGQPLFGFLVGPDDPRAPALLAFHGNAERAADMIPWAIEVAERTGRRVLVAESRGYAGLPGVPTYEGSRLDARAAHRWLRDTLGLSPDRVALSGYSLGTAVAVELAEEVGAPVLLLHAPFTSTGEMARTIAPRWLAAAWPWIARVHFDTRRRVAALDAEVWVAHGDADRVIPTRMGREVHAAARRRGGLLIVPGADHMDVESRGGERYWRFVTDALGPATSGGSGSVPDA